MEEEKVTKPAKEKKVGWWKRKTQSQKTGFFVSIIVFLISIGALFAWVYSRPIFGEEIGDTLLGEGNSNGWIVIGKRMVASSANFIFTFVAIGICIAVIFIANFLINLFTSKKSRKSQTIGSLLKSLVKYLTILVTIGFILTFWGMDVYGVIAGVGVLTLIIGLGCQTLIQDVISGLFIVFDDYFAVGDIVIIDGFRGVVSEVGLKTTKLTDFGGNIKSISNSTITTVVNLSRMDSKITVTIGCSYDEDVERVEAVIADAMDDFAKKIPNITKGPFYKGIDSIGASSINFLVLCYTKETDRFQVTRDINKELLLLFKENNVVIPYNQIVVNSEYDHKRPQASDVQLMISKKATNELRGIEQPIEKPIKKKTLLKKVKESIKETQKDMEKESL